MATTNWQKAELLENFAPRSHRATQRLVMAAADLNKNRGKTGLFGANKGVRAEMKFHDRLRELIYSVREDARGGIFDGDDLYDNVCSIIGLFCEAYPNWGDAYEELHNQLLANTTQGRALIDRLK
jgi:hypothetical protein